MSFQQTARSRIHAKVQTRFLKAPQWPLDGSIPSWCAGEGDPEFDDYADEECADDDEDTDEAQAEWLARRAM
jgi:hypothetical protein